MNSCRPGIKYSLETRGKIQTADQGSNADCRPGEKYSLETRGKIHTVDQG